MTSRCWASVRGEVARVTKLNNCCEPVNTTCGVVTTDGWVSAVITQEIEAASSITLKNAADKVCVYDPGCDSLLDLQVVLTLCKVNPELLSIITGQTMELDYAGVAVGFRRSTDLACDNRFALEMWTQVPNTACIPTTGGAAQKQYGYFLIPCVRSATISGAITIDGSNAITVELTAKTTIPSLWGTGPVNSGTDSWDVIPTNAANTPGHLAVPIGATQHDLIRLTTVPPPAIPVDCGCRALTGQPN